VRRPIEKIKAGKTRVFTIPPVDYTLLARKYCLAFSAGFYRTRLETFSAVGIDPYSYEWSRADEVLKEISETGFAGDFTNFDGTLNPELIMRSMDIIQDFYHDEHQKIRRTLAEEMVHTVQQCGDCIYITNQGNPSGNPLTVVINTLVNAMYLRLSWLNLARRFEPRFASMTAYAKYVREIIYGDDNKIAVSDVVGKWFNAPNVGRFLLDFGIIYTDPQKTVSYSGEPELFTISPNVHLDHLTFLKCATRSHVDFPSRKLAAMSLETIYELTNWTRLSPNNIIATIDNCQDALRFAYFHGKKFFQQLRVRFLLAFRDVAVHPTFLTYEELDAMFLNLGTLAESAV